jgi:hypothetical protein
MKSLSEIAAILEAEIAVRIKLQAQMVGSLYPRMLEDEIARLRTARNAVGFDSAGKTQCGPNE